MSLFYYQDLSKFLTVKDTEMRVTKALFIIIIIYYIILSSTHQTVGYQLITQDNDGYLYLNETLADKWLNNGNNVAVVGIVGPYRSGKSYLLNALIDNVCEHLYFLLFIVFLLCK